MIDKLAADIVVRCAEEIRNREQSLGSGVASDFAHYRRITGEIRGLLVAIEIAQQLGDIHDDDDD